MLQVVYLPGQNIEIEKFITISSMDELLDFIKFNKIKLLSNSLFLKKCKGKDIVNILLTINNDEDKIKIFSLDKFKFEHLV